MNCQRCGIELPGSRGAYRWRAEIIALGDDTLYPHGDLENQQVVRERLLAVLAQMNPEEIEADVYQLWEGVFCRYCRFELSRMLKRFLESK